MIKEDSYEWYALHGEWGERDMYISPSLRWFYRLKAVLCLLLDIEPRKGTDVYDHIHVTYTDGGQGYVPGEATYYWFEAVVVGHGLFSNWWATVYSDST